MKEWMVARWQERTTWDGIVMIGVCAGFLILGGLAEVVAWAGLLYGVWSVWDKE